MESASEAKWPRHPHGTAYHTGIGQLGTGNQSQRRGFTGAVDTKQPVRARRVKNGRNMIEDDLGMSVCSVELENVVKLDHFSKVAEALEFRSDGMALGVFELVTDENYITISEASTDIVD
jgi:hypothetical protein